VKPNTVKPRQVTKVEHKDLLYVHKFHTEYNNAISNLTS